MKKKLLIGVSIFTTILIVIMLSLNGTFAYKVINESPTKFEEEYESLNGKEATNVITYKDIELDSDNRFVYADFEKIKEIIKGTGIIYFGFPECPWCRNAVPVIEEAAKQVGVDQIYYLNVSSMRDEKKLDENGNVITLDEGTAEYKELLELLHDVLPEYKGLNDSNIKRIYVPLVMTFKNGKVIDSHLSTVDSQDNPYVDLTKEQSDELLKIYTDAFSQIAGICASEC